MVAAGAWWKEIGKQELIAFGVASLKCNRRNLGPVCSQDMILSFGPLWPVGPSLIYQKARKLV